MATQPPSTGVTLFNQQGGALPAHIANFFEAEGTNIVPKTTVPSLSPEGKVWTLSIDGQKSKMQRRNTDGDLEPLPIMKVVVLDYAKRRGRAYYEGEYDPAKASAPVCWSDDGEAPDSSLPGPFAAGVAVEPGSSRKINDKCTSCPMAVKGSKVTPQGKAVTACAQHLMVAVLPDPALGLPQPLQRPLRLKIAMTSIWDKQSPAQEQQGWLAFDNYVDWLNARGCKHTAAIVTKMKFDPDAAFPKIFFSAERSLDANELEMIKPMLHAEDVKKLLGGTWTPAGPDGVPKDQQTIAQPTVGEPTADAPLAAAAAPPPKAEKLPDGYAMAEGEQFSYADFKTSGWTDEQLIANGKLIAQKPPAAPPAEVVPAPAAPPAAEATVRTAETVVVGEQPAPAATAAPPTATAAEASPPAAEAVVVVAEAPAPAPSPSLSAPAAVVVQEPAQATAPAPAPTPQAPEPPAAQEAAAGATPAVSTEVPADVAELLDEWK